MSRWMVPPLVAATGLGFIQMVFKRHGRHYDAAFNQMMWEIWENTDRNRYIPLEHTERYLRLNDYLHNRSYWYQLCNEPPYGALERFCGVTVEEYNEHCLVIAKDRLRQLTET